MKEMKSNDVYLDSDGTLGISADVDISKVKRILLTQEGTHYGLMYYQDLPDTNVGDMNDSEIPNSCNFKPGDKFILEIGKRQLDEFEIAGTDCYIKIDLLKMLAPYNPEQNTETRRVVAVGDVVYRQQAIDAVTSICDSCDSGYCGDCRVGFPGKVNCTTVLMGLPSAQPEYEPVKAEDFAKTMSENTIYSFMAWYGTALELMERQGFVICKKTM